MLNERVIDLTKSVARYFENAGLFYGHGTANSWDEAALLVAHIAKLPMLMSGRLKHKYISPKTRTKIWALANLRVAKRIPMPYIIKKSYYAGKKFFVNSDVMIPRSPIAEVINAKFKPWHQPKSIGKLLDICTGSGCLAILAAKKLPQTSVVGLDISTAALNVANINVKQHALSNQVELIHSDLFSKVDANESFDVIISNPPYVSLNEYSDLPQEFYKEPKLAYIAKKNGLKIVIDILKKAHKYLAENGILIIELGNSIQNFRANYPNAEYTQLTFRYGGHGVILLTKQQLLRNKDVWK